MIVSGGPSKRDVFISHASEDKDSLARPLTNELIRRGLSVWFDEYELVLGDPLRQNIDNGLAESTVGVVILSHHFFAKSWPLRELEGLHARLTSGENNVIVPIWHELTEQDVLEYSPLLASLLAGNSTDGIQKLASDIERVLALRATVARPTATRIASPRLTTRRRHRLPRARAPVAPLTAEAPALSDSKGGESISGPTGLDLMERLTALADHATKLLITSDGESRVILAARGKPVAELARRSDGVLSINSTLISPTQRVLAPKADLLLRELTAASLSYLSIAEVDKVTIRSMSPTRHEAPSRSRPQAYQLTLVTAISAALQSRATREIRLRNGGSTMLVTKMFDTVKIFTLSSSYKPEQISSSSSSVYLADLLLKSIMEISSLEMPGIPLLEDRFNITARPNYSQLRVLAEELIAGNGRFELWQQLPVERAVLTARTSRSGYFVLEHPGNVPSVQRYSAAKMATFVEALERAMMSVTDSRNESLEVRAGWIIAAPFT